MNIERMCPARDGDLCETSRTRPSICRWCGDSTPDARAELDVAVEDLLHCATDYRAWPDLTSRADRVRLLMKKAGK